MRRPGIVAPPGPPSDVNLMLGWKPGAITCDFEHLRPNKVFEYKARFPDAAIIVRFPHPQNWFVNPEASAVRHARQIAAQWNGLKPLNPYVSFATELNLHHQNGDLDAANQPLYETEQFYKNIGWWVTRTAQVIKELAPAMNLIAPPFAPGRHEDGSPDNTGAITEPFAGYDFLADALPKYFDNTLAVHAWWGDLSGSDKAKLQDPQIASWYAFRWRRLLQMCRQRYNLDGKIVITRAGNFAAYDADFFDQLAFFSQKTLTDRRVLALTFYAWEDPAFDLKTIFNVWTQYIADVPGFTRKLAALPDISLAGDELPSVGEPAAPAPPESTLPADTTFDGPEIRILFDDGHTEIMPLEAYLRSVVPGEIPASWHAEALKAQTIAARTYAANAIRRARFLKKPYDIRANPDVAQNYRPDKIHPATDAAILATKGLILKFNRHPIDAVYSANCGGHTQNSEDVFRKADGSRADPTPYLRGVPCPAPGPKNGHGVGLCQHGADALAKMGLTYEQILTHYYTGAPLGFWEFTGSLPPATTTPALPTEAWQMQVTRTAGFAIIVGNLADRANIPITVTTPGGDQFATRSGSKPEFGVGGFEAAVNQPGTYTLSFLGQHFQIDADRQTTIRLAFSPPTSDAPAPPVSPPADEASAAPEVPPPQPTPIAQSTVSGIVTDPADNLLSGLTVRLQSSAGEQTAVTAADGRYAFRGLPAGTYRLTVPDTPLTETFSLDGQEFKSLNLKMIPAAPADEAWTVEVTPMPGSMPLMVGDTGEPNQPVSVTAPSGAQFMVVSGHKPEYGPGGFELFASERGPYLIRFADKEFMVTMTGKMLKLAFHRGPTPQARLISGSMPQSRAERLLTELQQEHEDIFTLDEVD